MIPFVDLKKQYLSIKDEIDAAINRVILNSSFIGGEEVKQFEENFAHWLGVKYFVSCANGTDSIEILLRAMGIGIGDEVIVPSLSWISTSEAVSSVGATPVFVDILNDFYTIDEDHIEKFITIKTKAIIPVHIYGQACDMDKIMLIAQKNNLKVIEDCAQAHGTMWNGKRVGTFGNAASFSFFPGKNLGAYGDAGGMAINDLELANISRMIANHGQITKHVHNIEGRNSRLDGLQAAVLNVKLNYLDDWIKNRRASADKYKEFLANSDKVLLPLERPNSEHSYHLFVVQMNQRELIKKQLLRDGIECSIHYPTALPFLNCYSHFGYTKETFPNVSSITENILSLPMFPELETSQIEYISNKLTNL